MATRRRHMVTQDGPTKSEFQISPHLHLSDGSKVSNPHLQRKGHGPGTTSHFTGDPLRLAPRDGMQRLLS